MKTLARYVAWTYLQFFLGIFAVILVIFLVTDFVDRAKAYTGPNWVADVAVLYGYKAIVVAQQLGPAALLLAAGATVSVIRKRGELTAINALSFGPRVLYLPIAACGALLALGMVAFDEWAVVKAGPKVDEITALRFKRWGDYRFYFQPKQWFRRGDRIFHLRSGSVDEGYGEVTVLRLGAEFELVQRLDARRMLHLADQRWRLEEVIDRRFLPGGATEVREALVAEYELGAGADAFRIRKGRPEQMRVMELREQIAARKEVGLPAQQFSLALHNRFAYPLAGLPAALLAVGLALRRERKGHLTAAVLEGLIISMTLWGIMVVCKTLVLADRMSPTVAAWTPWVVLVVGAAWAFASNAGWRRRAVA